jgi:hypothetical protein
MTNRFLISVAAMALIAGTGLANAQGAGGGMSQGGSGSTVQQHSAPSSGGATTQHREDSDMKAGQTGKMDSPKQAEELQKGQKARQNTASDNERGKTGKNLKAEGPEGKEGKSGTVGQAPDKSGAASKGHEEKTGQGREDRMNTQGQKGSMENNRAQTQQGGTQTTTGNAATTARVAAPPPEKRTQIVSAIKSEHIEDVTNVNVNVVVGTRLPNTVHFVPLPPRIVEIYPEWRGYEVVRIHGRYVIVQPDTREIVYIIES